MLDPITLISLLMLQTPTRISITARGEQGREGNVTLLLHISLFPAALGRRDTRRRALAEGGRGAWDAPASRAETPRSAKGWRLLPATVVSDLSRWSLPSPALASRCP